MSAGTTRDRSVLDPDVDDQAQATPAEPGAPTPDISKTASALGTVRARSLGITILSILALLYTLYFARDFLLPVVMALLLDLLFSPVVRAFTRIGIGAPLGAAIVVLGLLALVSFGAYELSTPVERWVTEAPATLARAEARMKKLTKPLERVRRTAEQVETATSATPPKATEVILRGPGLVARVFGTTQRFVAGSLEVLILLYFLLAAGDLFLQKLVKVLPQLGDKRTAVQIARKAESSISTYLVAAMAVNVGEGIVVAIVLYLLGMPNAPLWGVVVALLEFVPYLGAVTIIVVLSVAALTTFDSMTHALLIPAAFLAINLLQANVVSPLLYSRRLTLNPVALFVGLAFWWWIWGIPGAFVAVPLMATFKIFCDHIDSLAPIGEFLGQRDEEERRETVRVG